MHGILEICETKGYAQHYVALHGSMTDLLKQYDREVEKIYPGRTYCFRECDGQQLFQTMGSLYIPKAVGKSKRQARGV